MTDRNPRKPDPLTTYELIVLIVIKLYGPALYAKQIIPLSHGLMNKGNVYMTMSTLHKRKLLKKKGSKTAAPDSNYMVQYYQLTAKGERALVNWQKLLKKLLAKN